MNTTTAPRSFGVMPMVQIALAMLLIAGVVWVACTEASKFANSYAFGMVTSDAQKIQASLAKTTTELPAELKRAQGPTPLALTWKRDGSMPVAYKVQVGSHVCGDLANQKNALLSGWVLTCSDIPDNEGHHWARLQLPLEAPVT